jgi:lipopolysaccharide exporter
MSGPRSLTRQVGISSLWAMGTRVSVQLMSLVSVVALARWLGPDQLGLFEKAAIMLGLLDLLGALGLEQAIIQMRDPQRRHYDTAWTLNILRGLLTALVLLLLSLRADSWFAAPGLGQIMQVLALQPLLGGFENIGMVTARRDLRFQVDFWWMFIRRLVSFAVALTLAWFTRSPWAMVVAALASALAGLLMSYRLSGYRPRLSLAGWQDLRRFVGWMFGYTSIAALFAKLDDMLLLRFSLPADVAFYRRALDFAAMPSTELAAPLSRALLPGLSRLEAGSPERRRLLGTFMALIMMLALPAALGMALVAEPLVRLLLGARWLPTIRLIEILALMGVLRVYASLAEVSFMAAGRMDVPTKLIVASLLWRLPLMLGGLLSQGIAGLAMGSAMSAIVSIGCNLFMQRRLGLMQIRELLVLLWRPALAAAGMAGVLLLARPVLDTLSLLAQLLAAIALGMASYAALLLLLWRLAGCPAGPEQHLLAELRGRFTR